jgi:hypothetical protein
VFISLIRSRKQERASEGVDDLGGKVVGVKAGAKELVEVEAEQNIFWLLP